MPPLRTQVTIFVLIVFFTGLAAVGVLLRVLKNPVKALKRKARVGEFDVVATPPKDEEFLIARALHVAHSY